MKNLTAKLIGASLLTAGLVLSSTNAAFAKPDNNPGGGQTSSGGLTASKGSCSTSDVFGASACSGAYDGNDSNQNLGTLFDLSGWTQVSKVDGSGTNGGLTINGSGTSGTWSFSGFETGYSYMAVTKGGTDFSTYLLGADSIQNGVTNQSWTTAGLKNNGGNQPALSHFTVYKALGGAQAFAPGASSEEVPEPLTILGSGLALGFGAMFKKKQSNKG